MYLTGFPQGMERILEAFSIYHIFICLSYDPDIHFSLADDQETLLTRYPCPTKLCNCLPVDVENTCTDRSVDPASSLSPE